MRKLKLMALAGVIVSSLLIEHANAAAGSRGVDRIEELPRYKYYTQHCGGGYNSECFGFKIRKIGGDGHRKTFGGRWHRYFSILDRDHETLLPDSGMTEGSITDDIKSALIDKEHFDRALAGGRYYEAWSMGGTTTQGSLWRETAVDEAKKRVDELALRCALAKVHSEAESRPFETEANRIITSFPAGGIRDQLRRMYDDGVRLASPPVVTGASPAVRFDHALATERYFEAWNMAGETEEGRLRKEMAAAGAKKKVDELAVRSVLARAHSEGESRRFGERASAIITSFPETNPLRAELRRIFEDSVRLATPPAPGVDAELAVHRGIIARLLED